MSRVRSPAKRQPGGKQYGSGFRDSGAGTRSSLRRQRVIGIARF
ncbi:hypothetical protein [Raoultella ornithinolytica]|nr:hypothetical protein [Raoultella ornithinolytica]MCZ0884116.1 hypothetical protein [Raoultella ornithinolytica]MDV1099817.1 hypothetical protein [Raoultella ornithinolytica]